MSKHLFAALALLASLYAHASGVADFTKPNVPGAIPGGPRLPGAAPAPSPRPQYLNPQPTISPTDAVAPAGPPPERDKAGAATITDAAFTYDQVGNRTSMTLSNGVVTRYAYDRLNRLIELHTTKDGVTLQRHNYTLDASGLRTGVSSLDADGTHRTVAFGYDGVKRLTSEVHSESGVEVLNASYSYDRVGNRTQAVVNGVTTTYVYNVNDWLLSETTTGGSLPGTTTYTYDANGNRLTKSGPLGSIEYIYDDANRMVEMRDGADRITYDYNADGLLVAKTFFKPSLPSLTQRYVWDANRSVPQVMEELVSADGAAPRVVANYFFADDLIAQTRNGVTSFVVADGMGSTRALTDTGGAITDTFRYDAFGNVIGRTGSTPADHLYRGEQLDPNAGLYYLRARWMDPTIGRFTQMDSFAGLTSDPASLHKYLYANADPVNGFDPSGHMTMLDVNAGFAANSARLTMSTARVGVVRVGQMAANDALWSATAATSGARAAVLGILTAFALTSDSQRRDRFVGTPMIVFGKEFLGHARHISDAQQGNGSNFFAAPFALNRTPAWSRGWLRYTSECNDDARARAGGSKACDEYPFASTRQGGPANYVLGTVSLRFLELSESDRTRDFIRDFYNTSVQGRDGFSKESRFIALGIPGARSFYTDRSGNVHYWE